jgi:hypothetical protein
LDGLQNRVKIAGRICRVLPVKVMSHQYAYPVPEPPEDGVVFINRMIEGEPVRVQPRPPEPFQPEPPPSTLSKIIAFVRRRLPERYWTVRERLDAMRAREERQRHGRRDG